MTNPIRTLTASTALATLFAVAGPQIAAAQPTLCPEGVADADLPVECREDGAGSASAPKDPDADAQGEAEEDGASEESAEEDVKALEEALSEQGGAAVKVDPEVSAEAEADADAETEVESEPEPEPEPEAGPEPEPETEAEAEAEAEVVPDLPAPDQNDAAADDGRAGGTTPAELAEELIEKSGEMAGEAVKDADADADAAADAVEDAVDDAVGDGAEAVDEVAEDAEEAIDEVTEDESGNAARDADAAAEVEAETGMADGRPAQAAAAAAADGAGEEPMETTETTVTEEDARSSDEDFASGERDGDDDGDSGLSNFEKFAIGAAGLVVLDQLIGDNDEVVSNTGDRVVVRRDNGDLYVLKDDDVLLRRPGSDVQTETFSDGSTRTTVTREDGVQVVTIAAADGTVLRRTKIMADGRRVVLFDDTQETAPVVVSELPEPSRNVEIRAGDEAALRAALQTAERRDIGRRFSLAQVRNIEAVRELMPEINIDAINFETGSAAIRPEEAEDLYALGEAMNRFIEENPDELFLVEGHTDAIGSNVTNLALSDRRAESVALALTEYFDVPPENLVVQGYGEQFLLVPTEEAERSNRRATVRRITPLLTAQTR